MSLKKSDITIIVSDTLQQKGSQKTEDVSNMLIELAEQDI